MLAMEKREPKCYVSEEEKVGGDLRNGSGLSEAVDLPPLGWKGD